MFCFSYIKIERKQVEYFELNLFYYMDVYVRSKAEGSFTLSAERNSAERIEQKVSEQIVEPALKTLGHPKGHSTCLFCRQQREGIFFVVNQMVGFHSSKLPG